MRREEGISYGNLGSAHLVMGRGEKSIECFKKNLEISKELKDEQGEETVYCGLGCVNFFLGKYSKSLTYFQKRFCHTQENLWSSRGRDMHEQFMAGSSMSLANPRKQLNILSKG